MEGPPLGPGGEDITWPDQVALRGQKASSTRKIKPQTSNLFQSAALIDAPHPVQLVTVGCKPLSGGRKDVLSTVRVPVETPEGLRVLSAYKSSYMWPP